MRKFAVGLSLLVSSCLFPQFNIVQSFDDGAAGSAGLGRSGAGGMNGHPTAGNAGTPMLGAAGDENGDSSTSGAATGGAATGGAATGGASSGGASQGNAGSDGISCKSPPNLTACGSDCVDITSNRDHCGKCGGFCPIGGSCTKSTCACPTDQGECENLHCFPLTDERHCGGCTPCSGPQTCFNKKCSLCPTGCAVLTIPYTGADQETVFSIDFPQPVNLYGATVTFRAYRSGDPGLRFMGNIWDKGGDSAGIDILGRETDPLVTAELKVSGPAFTGFALTTKIAISLTGTATKNTTVWLDSIVIDTGVAGPWNFDTSAAPLADDKTLSNASGTIAWLKN